MPIDIPEKLAKDEWEKLPDAHKPIYRQSQNEPGIYEYAVPELANSMRHAKTERDQERQKREAAEAMAAAYKQFGDPKKFEDLSTREQMLKDSTRTMEEAMQRAKKEADERYGSLLNDQKTRIQQLEGSRCSDHQANIVSGLLAASRLKKGYEREVRLAIESGLRTEIRDGKPFTYVVDDSGGLAKDPDTFDPLSPERFFQQYRQSRGALFEGDTGDASGSGFNPGRGGQADAFDGDPLQWPFETKKAFFQANGANADAAYKRKLDAWATKRAQQKKAS